MEAKSSQPSSLFFWLLPALLAAVVVGQLLWIRNTPRVQEVSATSWRVFIPTSLEPGKGQRWLVKPRLAKRWSAQIKLISLKDKSHGIWLAEPTHWRPPRRLTPTHPIDPSAPGQLSLEKRGKSSLPEGLKKAPWIVLKRGKDGTIQLPQAKTKQGGRWLVYEGWKQPKGSAVGELTQDGKGFYRRAWDWRSIKKQSGPWSLRRHKGPTPKHLRSHAWPPTLTASLKQDPKHPQWQLKPPTPPLQLLSSKAYVWLAYPPKGARGSTHPIAWLRLHQRGQGWHDFSQINWAKAKGHKSLLLKARRSQPPNLSKRTAIASLSCSDPKPSRLGGKCVTVAVGRLQGATPHSWYVVDEHKGTHNHLVAKGFVQLKARLGLHQTEAFTYFWPPKQEHRSLRLLSDFERIKQALQLCYHMGYDAKMFGRIKRFPQKYARWRDEHGLLQQKLATIELLGRQPGSTDGKLPGPLTQCLTKIRQKIKGTYDKLAQEDAAKQAAASRPTSRPTARPPSRPTSQPTPSR